MKYLYILLVSMLFLSACDNDLEQFPTNVASSGSLEDFTGVLNAAYFYQLGTVTPMAVMGDFRADNAIMEEEPYPTFDRFSSELVVMEDQFFGPFYTACYKSILSANGVIENADKATAIQVGEAKFLRALSYFKLVRVFGDATINTSSTPDVSDDSVLARSSTSEVYSLIITDLQEAISALGAGSNGRASKMAAKALLGKVYVQQGDFSSAQSHLAEVVNGADAAGISLQANFADVFGVTNDLNSEIIFATQVTGSINDEYGFSEFWSWSAGLDTKSLEPLDPDLIAAFDASPGDLRRAVTIDTALMASPKFPQTDGPEHDWIEIRLADIMLLYAETLNETGSDGATALAVLDPIRTRAGLAPLDAGALGSQAAIRQAIQDERRLEMAFEGQRWFDLVRTGTVDAEMGESVNPNFYLFPVPSSEINATLGVITQNPGY